MGTFSEITEAVNFTFMFILAVSVILLVGITVLMVSFVIKYRRSKHPVAAQVEGHTVLEIVWTVIPTLLALGMFYYGWIGYKLMRDVPPGAMEVQAIGRMWSWSFEYPNGKKSNELYVPANNPVKVNLASTDVLHSFYVPAFMVKQDVVPGLDTYVWFSAPDSGTYDIFCTEYCGQRHSYMLSKVVVMPEREFETWVAKDVEPVKVDESADVEEKRRQLVLLGEHLSSVKGCVACHSVDGSSVVGPTYKGLYGKTQTVITDGQPRQITVDDEYLRISILNPNQDIVEGFQPLMPPQQGLVTEDDIKALTEYIKSIK